MQPALHGYLGLLQGQNLHLFSIKNDRETTMVISMASWIIKQKSTNG